MSEITRYEMILVTRCGEGWQELQKEPEGDWMLYDDHASEMKKSKDRIQELEDLVDKLLWINGVKIYRHQGVV